MTPEQFRARRPEFRTASDALVQAALDEAAASLSTEVYAAKHDRALSLKAADILARSPFGRSQRLVSEDGTTVYSAELDGLRGEVARRMIVV